MGNGAHARVLGAGTVTLKFTFEEDDTIEECAACTYYQEESSQRVSTV
jgi:hypothetical protein